jgi:hypothetical protein
MSEESAVVARILGAIMPGLAVIFYCVKPKKLATFGIVDQKNSKREVLQ